MEVGKRHGLNMPEYHEIRRPKGQGLPPTSRITAVHRSSLAAGSPKASLDPLRLGRNSTRLIASWRWTCLAMRQVRVFPYASGAWDLRRIQTGTRAVGRSLGSVWGFKDGATTCAALEVLSIWGSGVACASRYPLACAPRILLTWTQSLWQEMNEHVP